MEPQIDLVRLFKASGGELRQREHLRGNITGAVARQDVEGAQPAPAVVVIGQLQHTGPGGIHPPGTGQLLRIDQLEPHHEFATALMLGAIPVTTPGFTSVAADGAGGIVHIPIDAGIDEIIAVVYLGNRNGNLVTVQQKQLVDRNFDPVVEFVGSRTAGGQPRIGGIEHQLAAAVKPDPEAFGKTVRSFFIKILAVIQHTDMEPQIDLVRFREAPGRQFTQRKLLFCNTVGTIARQDIEAVQSTPAIAVVGQLQHAGQGRVHPPLRADQRQQCDRSNRGGGNSFQFIVHHHFSCKQFGVNNSDQGNTIFTDVLLRIYAPGQTFPSFLHCWMSPAEIAKTWPSAQPMLAFWLCRKSMPEAPVVREKE